MAFSLQSALTYLLTIGANLPSHKLPMLRYHLTLKSGNVKTGPMAVSTSSRSTCDAACPMRKACYAAQGPLSWHWDKVTRGERGDTWPDFLRRLRNLGYGLPFRGNQAGDLLSPLSNKGQVQLAQLKRSTRHLLAWTYTHHPVELSPHAMRILREPGIVINRSCESMAQADAMIAAGLPAVVVVAESHPNASRTPAGHKVTVCPAQIKDGITCSTCKLCATRAQNHVIAFRAHGKGRKHAPVA